MATEQALSAATTQAPIASHTVDRRVLAPGAMLAMMKALRFLLLLVVALLPSFAAGAPADSPGQVAEKFHAGYLAQVEANKDTTTTLVLTTSFGSEKQKITAKLVRTKDTWLLNAVE